jgi:hypothetical protein
MVVIVFQGGDDGRGYINIARVKCPEGRSPFLKEGG